MPNIDFNSEEEILIIENYISDETAKFLSTAFNEYLSLNPHGIFSGPGRAENAHEISSYNPIIPLTFNKETNLAVDIISMLCKLISFDVSKYAKKELVMKSVFYGIMRTGSRNGLHIDNYFQDSKGNIIDKEDSEEDYSGLLYLNDEYSGGELEFTKQNLKIKPKPGTLIIFKGDETKPHQVLPVLSGNRANIVMFFWPPYKIGSVTVVQ
jgi:2OG-Fe(II) oxygenase superfamily